MLAIIGSAPIRVVRSPQRREILFILADVEIWPQRVKPSFRPRVKRQEIIKQSVQRYKSNQEIQKEDVVR